jgi:hypothetical protein
MQMIIIETIKFFIALAILAFIAKFRETKPVCDSFFANQNWTLEEAYKILLPLLIAVFLLVAPLQLVPEPALLTSLILRLIA